MPAAVAYIATAAANYATGVVLAAGGIGAVNTAAAVGSAVFIATEVAITVGASIALNAAFAPKPPPLGAVTTPYKASMPPRQSGFGRSRITGPYMLFEAAEGVSFDVVALHDGEIDAVERYFLHDDEVEIGVGGGVWCPSDTRKYAYGFPGDRTFIETRLGVAGQSALSLPIDALIPGAWTADHRGEGVACLALKCKQSKDKFQMEDFPNGVPQPSVVARLQKVFDPRLGQDQADPGTYEWSANPVLALLKYLTNAPGGMGLDYARRIEPALQSWKNAAADCDRETLLLSGETEARYACGGIYQHTTAPSEVVNQLLQSFDGWLSQRGDGALVVLSGRYIPPSVTFTDDHVVAYSVQHFVSDEEAVNELVPSFSDPAADYNVVDAGAWRDEDDIEARGGPVRSQALPLPWVQSPSQARRLAKRRMSRLSATLRGSLTCNLYGFVGLGERYVRLKIRENAALTDIVVEVANVSIDLASLQVTYTWVLADPDIDAWDRFSEEQPGTPLPDRPTPSPLAVPTISDVTPFYETSGAEVLGARLRITAAADRDDLEWKARWRVTGSTAWTEGDYSDIDDGASVTLETGFVPVDVTLDVQVAYVTAGGISDWSATYVVAVPITTTSAFLDEDGHAFLDEAGLRFYEEA